MPLSTLLGLVHAAAATLALLTAGYAVRAGRRGAEIPGRGWLQVTLGSVASWSAHLSWWYLAGPSDAQVLWLPSVGGAMAGLLAWTATVLRPERPAARLWILVFLLDPVLLVGAQLVLGADAVATRYDDRIVYGWFYGVHVLLVFATMLATASLWAGSRSDPSPRLRVLSRVVIGALLAAGVAHGLQLMVLDLVLGVAGVAVVLLVVHADPGALEPRPRAVALLDGLGALVLVFDRDDHLVDLNAPARSFFARRDGAAPGVGTRAVDLLPMPIDQALTGVEVRLDAADEAVDFLCFAARLGPSTSPPHGSVVVLRPAVPETATDPDLAAHLARRIDQLASAAGASAPVVVLGLSFTSTADAQRAAQAMEFVVGSLDTLVVDLVGPRAVVAVGPARVEPYLVDVAAGWQPQTSDDLRVDEGAVRSVSLSPVLTGDRVLRHGPAGQASAMVSEVRQELVER